MRRLLVLVFVLLMPLQVAWASAATLCQHETAATTSHLGHHTHAHEDPSGDPAGPHLDCDVCHAATTPALMQAADSGIPFPGNRPGFAPGGLHPSSAPGDTPDRPQWRRLS